MLIVLAFVFILGIAVLPVLLFLALPIIVMPGDSYQIVWLRGWAILLSALSGPALLGLCTMNYTFTVKHFDPKKFSSHHLREKAARIEGVMTTLNQAYEAYWTKENRIAFACLACIVTAFALALAPFSLKPFEVAAIKLGGIIMAAGTATIAIIYHRLKKANN